MIRLVSIRLLIVLSLFNCGLVTDAKALELPQIFASHMVLQRDVPVCVWGTAQANSSVFVFFEKQRAITVADDKGYWKAWLQPLTVNRKGQTLTVWGDGVEIFFDDVLVGDVWLCSGQSNMEWPVRGLNEIDELLAEAEDQQLRLCEVGRHFAASPVSDTKMNWAVSDRKTIQGFSAVGYYFGKFLRRDLDVPIGLIRAAWGGTPCEAWTSSQAIDANPDLESIRELWGRQVADHPKRMARWQKASKKAYQKQLEWIKSHPDEDASKAQKKFRVPRKPFPPDATPFAPSVLFNGMIAPVLPFSMKGVIWYQGEANVGRPDEYRALLPTMINDWRSRWQPTQLPFGIVQLANFRTPLDHALPPVDTGWAHLRDAQRHTAMTMPNVGLAVTIDIGDANNIHPHNKRDVGKRLALWALHDVYEKQIAHCGPVFKSVTVQEHSLILRFDHVGKGIKTTDDKPITGFIIAGEDRKWHWAQVRITGPDTVEVWAQTLTHPVAVRYAWATNPVDANLTNDTGLPASPFRSDVWPFGH